MVKPELLQSVWDFHDKNVDGAWYLLEWIAWDSFEFEKASHVYGYSFSNTCAFYSRSYYGPFCCDLCKSSEHDTNSCPHYA